MLVFAFSSSILCWYACKFRLLKKRKKIGHSCIVFSSGTWCHQVHYAHSTTLSRSCKIYWLNWKMKHNLFLWKYYGLILSEHSKCSIDHFMGGAHLKQIMPMFIVMYILTFVTISTTSTLANLFIIFHIPQKLCLQKLHPLAHPIYGYSHTNMYH